MRRPSGISRTSRRTSKNIAAYREILDKEERVEKATRREQLSAEARRLMLADRESLAGLAEQVGVLLRWYAEHVAPVRAEVDRFVEQHGSEFGLSHAFDVPTEVLYALAPFIDTAQQGDSINLDEVHLAIAALVAERDEWRRRNVTQYDNKAAAGFGQPWSERRTGNLSE